MALLTSIKKELLLIWRDRIGLALLFLMPLAFVVIITLIQNNSMGSGADRLQLPVLLVNQDKGSQFADLITKDVEASQLFKIQKTQNGKPLTEATARKAVAQGQFQVLIIIPPGEHASIEQYTKDLTNGDLKNLTTPEPLNLVFDPNIAPALRQTIEKSLQMITEELKISALAKAVSKELETEIPASALQFDSVHSEFAQLAHSQLRPNAVQQNVPAWAIFGMFFIVIPISGTFLFERNYGVLSRIQVAPVSFITVLLGKILAYSMVNMVQLGLMLLVGVTLLPALGTPMLSFGAHPWLIVLTGFIVALAATSLGLFLGTIVRTYQQVSSVGSLLVVIGAAIGGIMVPVYVMPPMLQKISILSPLNWAHHAFIDIFVRGAGLTNIMPQLFMLLGFFVVMMGLTYCVFQKNGK